MQLIRKNKFGISVLVASMLLLNGCTTTNPYTGQQQTSDATVGTGVGAIGGAGLGAILGGGKGALIGGAVGALTGGLVGNSFDKENADLRRSLVDTGVQVDQVGDSVQLVMASDVTFSTNQAAIRSGFYQTLDSVAVVLRRYNNHNIVISGYTDSTGGDGYNQELSEARARSVGDYLISQGIPPGQIFTQGFGSRYPVASNNTARGRSMNRRVVVTLR
jgi:outer membrane protein OmpA-like peptidoglycan-associated protein